MKASSTEIRKMAQAGFPGSQNQLGTFYAEANDFKTAAEWCQQTPLNINLSLYMRALLFQENDYNDSLIYVLELYKCRSVKKD